MKSSQFFLNPFEFSLIKVSNGPDVLPLQMNFDPLDANF